MRYGQSSHIQQRLLAWLRVHATVWLIAPIAFVQWFDGDATLLAADPGNELLDEYPLSEPIWKGRDLSGDIAGDRQLSVRDLDLLLRLSKYLIDKRNDESKRSSAAQALGALGHQHAIPVLLAVIRDEEDHFDVRSESLVALSQISDKRVVDYLIEELDGEFSSGAMDQLIKITGVGIGFGKEHDTTAKRRELQADWRAWWATNNKHAYLRSRTHALKSMPIFFWSVEEWKPEFVRPQEDQ